MFRRLYRATAHTSTLYMAGAAVMSVVIVAGLTAYVASGSLPSDPSFDVPPVPDDAQAPNATDVPTQTTFTELALPSTPEAVATAIAVAPAPTSPPQPTVAPPPSPAAASVNPVVGAVQTSATRQPSAEAVFDREATIVSHWHPPTAAPQTVVVSGASRANPGRGFVGIAAARNGGMIAVTKMLTPTEHGSVRISAVHGAVVTLVARDGTVFTFDAKTHVFTK